MNADKKLFTYRNLIDATLMTAAFELRIEEFIHNLLCHVVVYETSWHDKHVGIVVLADEMSNLWYPAQTGSDGLMLVQSHVDALTAAADGYSREYLSLLDAFCKGMSEIGVVAALLAEGAIVLICYAVLIEVLLYVLLKLIACMVAGYAYGLNVHNYFS